MGLYLVGTSEGRLRFQVAVYRKLEGLDLLQQTLLLRPQQSHVGVQQLAIRTSSRKFCFQPHLLVPELPVFLSKLGYRRLELLEIVIDCRTINCLCLSAASHLSVPLFNIAEVDLSQQLL